MGSTTLEIGSTLTLGDGNDVTRIALDTNSKGRTEVIEETREASSRPSTSSAALQGPPSSSLNMLHSTQTSFVQPKTGSCDHLTPLSSFGFACIIVAAMNILV